MLGMEARRISELELELELGSNSELLQKTSLQSFTSTGGREPEIHAKFCYSVSVHFIVGFKSKLEKLAGKIFTSTSPSIHACMEQRSRASRNT
jgi:hypothetical protein